MSVNGKSSIYLDGDSSINGNYVDAFNNGVFQVTNGGTLEIGEKATVSSNIESMNTSRNAW